MDSAAWTQTRRNFHDYLISCGKAPGTANTYIYNLRLFWNDCGRYEVTPYQADRPLVRGWIAERLQKVSSTRVHNELAAVRSFYRWLLEIRDREDDPTLGIRVKRTRSLPTEPLSDDEVSALLSGCTEERDRLIVLVLAASGLRVSELAALRAEDINWQARLIKVHGKGDKERRITLPADLFNRLHAFAGMFPEGAIFRSKVQERPLASHQLRKIIYEISDRAKLTGVHPHRFRSYFATTMMEAYGDIQGLQAMMGHESIETTARYSEYTRDRRGRDQMGRLRLPA